MGCSPFKLSSSSYDKPSDVNPNPKNFTVVETFDGAVGVAAIIKYHDCTNYEGIKIIAWLGKASVDIENATLIDPHFSEKDPMCPDARFKPTEQGWEAAKRYVS